MHRILAGTDKHTKRVIITRTPSTFYSFRIKVAGGLYICEIPEPLEEGGGIVRHITNSEEEILKRISAGNGTKKFWTFQEVIQEALTTERQEKT